MMCQPASHHAWLPAKRRSPAKSVYIIDGTENSNLSQMQSVHLDTMGAVITKDQDISNFIVHWEVKLCPAPWNEGGIN